MRNVHSFVIGPNRHFIKPRVGVDRLLESLRTRFDMHVYTMGVRAYAEQVVTRLDPSRKLFKNVVTRDDCPGTHATHSRQAARRVMVDLSAVS
jgi:RNA polymerase II subunit A C-terminal domain phosphatase